MNLHQKKKKKLKTEKEHQRRNKSKIKYFIFLFLVALKDSCWNNNSNNVLCAYTKNETDIVAQGWEMELGITMYEMPELHGALEGETEVFVL